MINFFSATYAEWLLMGTAGLQLLLALVRMLNQQLLPSKLLVLMNKLLLLIGTGILARYALEIFAAWYIGYLYEQLAFYNRALGGYGNTLFFFTFLGLLGTPQLLWFQKIRTSAGRTAFVCGVILLSYYLLYNHVLLITSVYRDYLPSSWSS